MVFELQSTIQEPEIVSYSLWALPALQANIDYIFQDVENQL